MKEYSSYISDDGPNYRDTIVSWRDITHKRLWWQYGPERALTISQGNDHDTQVDLAKWKALGRPAERRA